MSNAAWQNNNVQFPRLIAEAQAAGTFTPVVLADMAESMDLTPELICEVIERAVTTFDDIVAALPQQRRRP